MPFGLFCPVLCLAGRLYSYSLIGVCLSSGIKMYLCMYGETFALLQHQTFVFAASSPKRKNRWRCRFLCQRPPRVCLWNSFIKASQQLHTDLLHFHLALMLSHLTLIALQTTESDWSDVHIFSPRRWVFTWWWRVGRDKTPCSRFWVICVFHWLPHSEGSTF